MYQHFGNLTNNSLTGTPFIIVFNFERHLQTFLSMVFFDKPTFLVQLSQHFILQFGFCHKC